MQNNPQHRNPDGSCSPFTSMYLGQIDFEENSGSSAPYSFYDIPDLCANATHTQISTSSRSNYFHRINPV